MCRPTLTDLANEYQSDKGTTFAQCHGYTLVYDRLLRPLRDKAICLLEIGLRHDPYYERLDRTNSPSVQMWLGYFPRAKVFGVDIDDFTAMSGDRVKVFQGDQGDPSFLESLVNALPPLDIVIDDGSHASFHQQMSFKYLFPRVKRKGFYFIEDLHWQPHWENGLPHVPLTRDLFSSPAVQTFCEISLHNNGNLGLVRWRAAADRGHPA